MKEIVYKVLGKEPGGTLSSVVVTERAGRVYKSGVTHKAPKWLADKGYHITAFRRRKAAHYFAEHVLIASGIQTQIWKCEVTGIIPRRKLPHICWMSELRKGELVLVPGGVLRWPSGTVMCKTIKLLERVE